jgi:hypothetical protein
MRALFIIPDINNMISMRTYEVGQGNFVWWWFCEQFILMKNSNKTLAIARVLLILVTTIGEFS